MTPKHQTQAIEKQAAAIREIREEMVSELNELEGMNVEKTADQVYSASRPKKGDPVSYRGEHSGHVDSVDGRICSIIFADGHRDVFIWCFPEGLNTLHDWPTKAL